MHTSILSPPNPAGRARLEQQLRRLDERPSATAYAEAAREIREMRDDIRPIRISQLSSFTVDPLIPYLEVEAARTGFAANVYIAPFNSVQQELLDPKSGSASHDPAVVFLSVLLEDLCPELALDFLGLAESDADRLAEGALQGLLGAIQSFRERSPAAVVVNNFALPASPSLGLAESSVARSQTAAIRQLNQRLTTELASISGTYVLDFDRLCAEVGYARWRNEKMWHLGRAPLGEMALIRLATAQAAFVQAIAGTPRKCLVIDLDNTLWGGVIGEDGVGGIALGHTYPGNAYREVQRALLQLFRRGVLLAINSKNNQTDVDQVFDSHPDMLLKREHFAATRINWDPKPENLAQIADELNIGIDSLVYLDDSPTECALMRQLYPEVVTWEACDHEGRPEPLGTLRRLQETRLFDRLALTSEDRRRGEMYQQQQSRRQFESTATSLDDFLQGLQLKVAISVVDDFSMNRVVELLHKTNQFNLTTRRHSAAEVAVMRAHSQFGLFSAQAVDRFGDHGIIGVVIVELDHSTARIDSFLLSCRVIGRRIETAMLAFVADWAREHGAQRLLGDFLPTAKNAPAATFFSDHGFHRAGEPSNETQRWELDLQQGGVECPGCISLERPAAPETPMAAESPELTERLYRTTAAVLNVDVNSLSDDSSPESLTSWDSLNHLNLVMALESEFQTNFTPEDTLRMHNLAAIRRLLSGGRDPHGSTGVEFIDCLRSHLPELKRFIAKSYGERYVLGINDAYFRWQYESSPISQGHDFHLRLARVDGEIAACLGYVPVDVSTGTRMVRGCWLANWMVSPDQRHVGLGPLLAQNVARGFDATLALGANQEAKDIFARMGWTDFGMLQRSVRVIDPVQAAQLCESGQLDWPARLDLGPGRFDEMVSRVERFDAEATSLWDQLCDAEQIAGTRRSAEFLNWRYADHSDFSYRMWEARRGGELVGFAVYRLETARDLPIRIARLVELVGDRDAGPGLIHAVLLDAQRESAVAMDFFCSSSRWQAVLSAWGFLPGEHPAAASIPILYQPIDRRRAGIRFLADLKLIPDTAHTMDWYVTKADGDQDRPN